MNEKSEAGRKGRVRGRLFELKVRKEMEAQGWTIAKWTNNVDFSDNIAGVMIPAKRKYNPFTKFASFGNGFPDFIAFKRNMETYDVIGVEVKSRGYLDKEERLKCIWLLQNKIFSRIVIAKKGKERGEVVYTDFDPS